MFFSAAVFAGNAVAVNAGRVESNVVRAKAALAAVPKDSHNGRLGRDGKEETRDESRRAIGKTQWAFSVDEE